jgi:hypothetical protein
VKNKPLREKCKARPIVFRRIYSEVKRSKNTTLDPEEKGLGQRDYMSVHYVCFSSFEFPPTIHMLQKLFPRQNQCPI